MDRYDPVPWDQGMACSLQENTAFVIDLGAHRLLLQGQAALGHQEIQFGKDIGIADQKIS